MTELAMQVQGLEKTSLLDVVAGDTVAFIKSRSFRGNVYGRVTVERTTKTHIILSGDLHFKKTSGEQIGGSSSYPMTLYALGYRQKKAWGVTEEPLTMHEVVDREQVRETEAKRRAGVLSDLRHLVEDNQNFHQVTTERLEEALAILREVKE